MLSKACFQNGHTLITHILKNKQHRYFAGGLRTLQERANTPITGLKKLGFDLKEMHAVLIERPESVFLPLRIASRVCE